MRLLVECRHGAVPADMPATTPGLNGVDGDIELRGARQQIAARDWNAALADIRAAGAVDLAQPARFNVPQHLFPGAFGVSEDDRIEVFRRLLRAKRWVKSATDDSLAARLELAGDLVGPRRQCGHESDADHVDVGVEIKRLDVLIRDPNRMFGWRQRGHRRQRQHAESKHGALRHRGALPRY